MTSVNPITKHREFNGTAGAIGITLGLPLFLLVVAFACNETYSVKGWKLDTTKIWQQVPKSMEQWWDLCFDAKCWKAYLAWFGVLAVLDQVLPGKHLQGIELRDGTKLDYKINGMYNILLLVTALSSRAFASDNYYLPELQFLYDNQLKLTLVTVVFSFLLAVFVYVGSFIPLAKPNGAGTRERILSINGNTGNPFYDWFIGRELNPRIGSFDIKLFCELRPGLLLWLLINLSCIHHQYHQYHHVSDSIVLVTLLQAFYVVDAVINEEGVISMMDITTDGFGFMLSFGDLAWLPWSYTIQTRYLALPHNNVELGLGYSALIVVLSLVGYYIFHSSNQQKSDFRLGKLDHLHLKSIKTKTGSKLLCDGWWGLSQHINYFGDWIIGWSWCLPTGFQTVFTYFYVVYFGTLLLHRQQRDEAKCREKYGLQWQEYEKKVPFKIIPYVY